MENLQEGSSGIRCLGGWCVRRDSCLHYRPGAMPLLRPVLLERLCERGSADAFQPKKEIERCKTPATT